MLLIALVQRLLLLHRWYNNVDVRVDVRCIHTWLILTKIVLAYH